MMCTREIRLKTQMRELYCGCSKQSSQRFCQWVPN